MTSYIREYGPELALDFPVIAIRPGSKIPRDDSWTENYLDSKACANYDCEGSGIGIVTGVDKNGFRIYGLDFDIRGDEDFANEMRAKAYEILGVKEAAYRVGSFPKFLIPVCAIDLELPKQLSAVYTKNGSDSQLEILGKGQQFVAFARHPATGRDYAWFNTHEAEGVLPPPYLLPEFKEPMVKELMDAFDELAVKHGWVKKSEAKRRTFSSDIDADLFPSYRTLIPLQKVRQYVMDRDDYADYDPWLKVGMALHHEFCNTDQEEDAIYLWDEYSKQAPSLPNGKGYQGIELLRRKWEGFGDCKGRKVTVRFLKRDYDEKHGIEREYTERARAIRLAGLVCGSLIYGYNSRRWYRWKGYHWDCVPVEEVTGLAGWACDDLLREDFAEELNSADKDVSKAAHHFLRQMQTAAAMKHVVDILKTFPDISKSDEIFDSNTRYFGVANGEIDLETGEFIEPKQDHYILSYSPVVYDPYAKCPMWEETLATTIEDEDSVKTVQTLFGYSMFGDPKEHLLAIFYGDGCNGKSTVLNTVRAVLGGYSWVAAADMMMQAKASSAASARPDIVALAGKRFVAISESEEEARLRESVVKNLVSEEEISARGNYESQRQIKPTWQIVMATNHAPSYTGSDEGINRRLLLVAFEHNFDKDPGKKKDVDRSKKLRSEYPGILNWLLEGAKRYKENQSLYISPKIKSATKQYKEDNDVMLAFLEEHYEICTNLPVEEQPNEVDALHLISEYKSWVGLRGYKVSTSSKAITIALKAKGIERVRKRIQGQRKIPYVYRGIKPFEEEN